MPLKEEELIAEEDEDEILRDLTERREHRIDMRSRPLSEVEPLNVNFIFRKYIFLVEWFDPGTI